MSENEGPIRVASDYNPIPFSARMGLAIAKAKISLCTPEEAKKAAAAQLKRDGDLLTKNLEAIAKQAKERCKGIASSPSRHAIASQASTSSTSLPREKTSHKGVR